MYWVLLINLIPGIAIGEIHMRTAAIICEFNPFHNGHAYILSQLREKHGADYIIAIMSGNYVQRGEPALFDKYTRAKAALKGDGDKGYADVVIELPTLYSTASAADFAQYGVLLALWSKVVDILGFGVEDGVQLEDIARQAELKDELEEDESVNAAIRKMLSLGFSYPEAEAACLGNAEGFSFAPNNILATEYLRALNKFDIEHHIEPAAISRIGDGFNTPMALDAKYCSATALRGMLTAPEGTCLIYDKYMPDSSYLKTSRLISPDIMSGLLSKALLDAKYKGIPLTAYSDVSREIADRLIKLADKPMSFTERIAAVKTKQYTYTRISRALLHIALGIAKPAVSASACCKHTDFVRLHDASNYVERSEIESQINLHKAYGDVRHFALNNTISHTEVGNCIDHPLTDNHNCHSSHKDYIRLLGFRRDAAPFLKKLKACSAVPVITKVADHASLMADEIYYSELLYALTGEKSEYEHSPIIL